MLEFTIIDNLREEVLRWSNLTNETIPAGTVITMTYGNTDFYEPLSLSGSGDQIFAYQGSEENPTLLFGLNYDNEEWVPSSTNGNNSALPPALNSYKFVGCNWTFHY